MRILFITSYVVMWFVSCANVNSFQNYEGVYVLNTNELDTLIIKNIRINKHRNFYYGNYERRILRDDSILITESTLAYDITMGNLMFDDWQLITQEETTDPNYFYFKSDENKRSYVSMDWYKNIFGHRFIVCDLDNMRYYEKRY